MSGYLLDTNVLSEFARVQTADQSVDGWLKAIPEEQIFVSILTFAEIRFGIELLPASKRRDQLEAWLDDLRISFQSRLLTISAEIGERWAVLSAQAQQRGNRLPIVDGLIAATALEYDLVLVTRNVKDFTSLGLEILNPWEK